MQHATKSHGQQRDEAGESADDTDRGRDAELPTDIPVRGWKDIAVRTGKEVTTDQVPMMGAAVAFYSLLALVPALVAAVSIYGLVADPAKVEGQVGGWLAAAPAEVRQLAVTQLKSITANAGAGASFGIVIGILVALWSASSGMSHLIQAVNVAYDEEETRTWVRRRLLALALTCGAIAFLLFAVIVIAVVPALIADTGLGALGRIVGGILRWVVLLVGMMSALTVLYRYAPDRDEPRWSWTSPGAIAATVLWLVASAVFSLYTANFGKYNETYGSLGAVVVVMLWLFITAVAVILGAELNAELERQTAHDTTKGAEAPLGTRRAVAADTVGAATD